MVLNLNEWHGAAFRLTSLSRDIYLVIINRTAIKFYLTNQTLTVNVKSPS